MKQLLCILFCSVTFLSLAQESGLESRVHGKVIDSLGVLENVYIRNMSQGKYTISNRNGNFTLIANLADTLRLTYVGFKDVEYILTEKDFADAGILLQMHESTEELADVTVIQDTINEVSLGIMKSRVKPKTKQERALFAASHMAYHWTDFLDNGIKVPFDPLINLISGRTKELKKQVALEKDAKNVTALYEQFYVYLTTTLKIPEEEIMLFCYYLTDQEKDEALLKAETNLGELLITEYYQEYQQQKTSE